MRLEFAYDYADVKDAYMAVNKRVFVKAYAFLAAIFLLRLGLFLFSRASEAAQGVPEDQRDSVLSLVVPLAIFLALWIPLQWFLRGGSKRKKFWLQNPSMQRPKMADITAERVVLEDIYQRLEFRWPAFTRFRETKRLFCLYTSAQTLHIFPKRAFASPEEMDAFRNMARHLVSENPSAPGFAVGMPPGTTPIPVPAPPPLPGPTSI